jgi:Zn ribbon nucleic-acid-binding protein
MMKWLMNSETGELHPALMKDITALRAVVENPELRLVAAVECPKCEGDGYTLEFWVGDFRHRETCQECHGKKQIIWQAKEDE